MRMPTPLATIDAWTMTTARGWFGGYEYSR